MATLNPAPPTFCRQNETDVGSHSLAIVPACPAQLSTREYRVSVGSRVFQGRDIRGLLRLAVAAHRAQS